MFVKIFFQVIAEKQLTKLARLLTYQEKLLLRQHTLTQRKRRQKNRLICIQLRPLRTRFEIKDTWIENDFDLFFWGGGGWRGEMENCAYLRKNPGYAPEATKTSKQKGRISHFRSTSGQQFCSHISGLHTFGRKQQLLRLSAMHHRMYGSI